MGAGRWHAQARASDRVDAVGRKDASPNRRQGLRANGGRHAPAPSAPAVQPARSRRLIRHPYRKRKTSLEAEGEELPVVPVPDRRPRTATQFERLLMDRVASALAYLDADLNFKFGNRACAHWLAADAGSLVDAPWRSLLGADLYEADQARLQAALRGQEQRFAREHPGADRASRLALVHYQPDRIGDKVLGILVQLTDISGFGTARHVPPGDDSLLPELFMRCPDGVAMTDAQGRLVEVNQALCALLGLARAEILGATFRSLACACESARPHPAPERTAAQEWDLRHKDGRVVRVQVRSVVLADGRGVIFLRDISDAHQALARASGLAEDLAQQLRARLPNPPDGR